MFKNIKTIITFYKLSKVKFLLIFLMFLTLIIPALLSILTPILLSNAITAITIYDFKKAIYQITIEFIIIIISSLSYFLYHLISSKVNKTIITNFQTYIYYNVKNNKKVNNISLSIIKDISTCSEFNKNIIYKFCFFIKSVIILIIIFSYSKILSLLIIIVSIISYYLLKLTDNKIQYKNKELSKYEIVSVDLFNSICNAESAEKNYNLESALKDKYFQYVNENIKTKNSISFLYNINNNFISLILKATIFISTLFLINQVKLTILTLSTYLILTPYLTSSAENLISFFDVFSEIGLMSNILDEFQSLKYIENIKKETPINLKSYNLYFYNVAISGLNEINLKINHNDAICFVDEDSNFVKIFNVLTKKSNIDGGCIFLDDKNIDSIDNQTYNKLVASVTTDEHFFNMSIYENFYLVCPNRNKIFKAIRFLNLFDYINNFDEKINTKINEKILAKEKFFLGLIRAYLSNAQIINIYNQPENLTKNERNLLKSILLKLKTKCTVICYFVEENYTNVFDKIYQIKNLKLKVNNLSNFADNTIRN